MAALSAILKYLVSVLVCYVLLAVPSQGIYVKDRSSRQRGGERSRGRDGQADDTSVEERRREPFTRTLVLCEADRECPYKYYCHSGEGHKSCLRCRKSHRRCHRNKMCCAGNTCVNGRCIPHQFRFDEAYNTAVQNFESEGNEEEEEMSINQDTKFNLRKARQGDQCSSSVECEDGLCCAQHLWSKMCKPMLEEGDICTKKRDRLTDVFQRCECSEGLSCKRDSLPERRLHVCQAVKHRSSGTSTDQRGTAEEAVQGGTVSQRERILSLPVEKIRPLPSKNDGDLLGYLSAESGEKLFDLASRGERWMMHGRSGSKLKGTAYRDTTQITRTEQADIEASQLTVL